MEYQKYIDLKNQNHNYFLCDHWWIILSQMLYSQLQSFFNTNKISNIMSNTYGQVFHPQKYIHNTTFVKFHENLLVCPWPSYFGLWYFHFTFLVFFLVVASISHIIKFQTKEKKLFLVHSRTPHHSWMHFSWFIKFKAHVLWNGFHFMVNHCTFHVFTLSVDLQSTLYMCKKYLDVRIIKLSMQNFIVGMGVRERHEYYTTTSFQIWWKGRSSHCGNLKTSTC